MTTLLDRPPSAATTPRGPTLDTVYVVVVLGVVVAAALAIGVRPHDFWWHLANGRTIVETGILPTTDTFTYTRQGEPFFNQMWLAQAGMYVLYRLGGVSLIVAFHALVIGAAYAMLLRLCVTLTGRVRLSAVVLLCVALPISFFNWAVRPQAYAFALFVGFLVLLLRFGEEGRTSWSSARLWVLPILMVLWVNVHGSFVVGLVIVALVAAMEVGRAALAGRDELMARGRTLLTATATTTASAMLNPEGPAVFGYVARLTTNESVAQASEWRPPSITEVDGALYFVAVAAVIALLVHRRRPLSPRTTVLVITFALLGTTASRHSIWFALIATPVVCQQLAAMLRPPSPDRGSPALNGFLVLAVIVAVVAMSPWVRTVVPNRSLGPVVRETPVHALATLSALPEGPSRLFNDLGYGSYLAWAAPEQKAFIDPRFELFPLDQIRDYRSLSEGRYVQTIIDKYRFDGFLVSRGYQPSLIAWLERSPDWHIRYQDEEAVLFIPV